MRPEHNFKLDSEDWAEQVVLAASHFRLHRYHGRGGVDRMQVKTFREAFAAATEALKVSGVRVLVYAITDSGRSTLVDQKKWGRYLELCRS